MDTLTLPALNPLEFVGRLKTAGMPAEQAEVQAHALHKALAEYRQAFSAWAQTVSAPESKLTALEDNTRHDVGQMATKGDIHTGVVRSPLRSQACNWCGRMLS